MNGDYVMYPLAIASAAIEPSSSTFLAFLRTGRPGVRIWLLLLLSLLPISLGSAQDAATAQGETCAQLVGPEVGFGIQSLFENQSAADHAILICEDEAATSPADMEILAYLARAFGAVERYPEMREVAERSASSGNPAGQWVKAQIFEYGVGQESDSGEALKWYRRSAEQGYAAAQFIIGSYYLRGEGGLPTDTGLAIGWMGRAAEQGYSPALSALIEMYDLGDKVQADPAESFRLLKLWAAHGDLNAQWHVGMRLGEGLGVDRNDTEAVRWFQKAAARGFIKAQVSLGHFSLQGRGMKQDDAAAVRWFRAGAEQGDAAAQNSLGYTYGTGRGVQQDRTEAFRLYRLSAEQGYPLAQSNVGEYYAEGKGVEQDFEKAAEFYRKSAESRFPPAMVQLGNLYREGKGVVKDSAEAIYWYEEARLLGEAGAEEASKAELGALLAAADSGSGDASLSLGILYERGLGVEQDDKLAANYYRVAAEAGVARAQHQVGLLFRDGRGAQQDDRTAADWLRRAVAQKYQPAFGDLKELYTLGRGLPAEHSSGEAAHVLRSTGGRSNTCLLDETMHGRASRELPVKVTMTATAVQPTVDDTIVVSWHLLHESPIGCGTPRYLIVSMPDHVRLFGSGFVALRPGQDAPFDIAIDKHKLRVVVPLYFGDTSQEGEFRIKPAKAGHFDIRWFLAEVPKTDVASRDRATVLTYATLIATPFDGERQWEIGVGMPAIFVQDRYSLDEPNHVMTSNDGTYVLRVFRGFFQVHDSRTQALVLEGPGWNPNFSPTSRFVAAYGGVSEDANFNVSVYDLVTGAAIHQPDKDGVDEFTLKQRVTQIAWFAKDSFVLLAAPSSTGTILLSTVIDGATFGIPGRCNACGVWEIGFRYDNDLLTFSDSAEVAGYLGYLPFPGISGVYKLDNDLDEADLAVAAAFGGIVANARLIDTTETPYNSDGIAWRLGDKLELSHAVEAGYGIGNPLDYVVRHTKASPSAAEKQAASQATGERYAARGARMLRDLSSLEKSDGWSMRIEERLLSLGIRLAPTTIGRHDEVVADEYSGGTFGAQFATDVTAQSAFGGKVFATTGGSAQSKPGCIEIDDSNESLFDGETSQVDEGAKPDWWKEWDPAWGDRRIATNPLFIFATWRWDLPDEKLWAYQTVCANAGTGQFTQGMHGLLRQSEDGKAEAIWLSNLKWRGTRLNALLALSRPESLVAFISQGRYLLMGSRNASAFIAVYDLKEQRLIAGINGVRDGYLMERLHLTFDGRALLQWNGDGQFHLYSLDTLDQFLSGYYLDDEVVLYDSRGYYDATTEGASFVHLSFAGSSESHDLRQFARTLHRPDIIQAALSWRSANETAPLLSAPPQVTAEVIGRPTDSAIMLKVEAGSKLGLEKLRIHRDGYLLENLQVQGNELRRELKVHLPGETRWLAVTAIDIKGYESATVLLDIRQGTDAPARSANGRLFVLGVGVDHYRNLPALRYAGLDATSFVDAVKKMKSGYYRGVEATTMTDSEATVSSIFDSISKIARDAGPTDTIALFFAGHGVRDKDKFYVALSETQLDDLPATALSWNSLSERLEQLPARVIVVLDACHSGLAGQGATNDEYAEALRGASVAVLAASKGRQYSLERPGGGVFTASLTKVISQDRQQFDQNRNGVLELSELYAGVKSNVVMATGGQQTPWIAINRMVGEVPLF